MTLMELNYYYDDEKKVPELSYSWLNVSDSSIVAQYILLKDKMKNDYLSEMDPGLKSVKSGKYSFIKKCLNEFDFASVISKNSDFKTISEYLSIQLNSYKDKIKYALSNNFIDKARYYYGNYCMILIMIDIFEKFWRKYHAS